MKKTVYLKGVTETSVMAVPEADKHFSRFRSLPIHIVVCGREDVVNVVSEINERIVFDMVLK